MAATRTEAALKRAALGIVVALLGLLVSCFLLLSYGRG
jgi:hypothetical protein